MVKHYNLDVIISVGYRVKSKQGTQFRQWATKRIHEYLVKGFTMDDERLKQEGAKSRYFEELLQRIRDIRSSERNFHQKITDIYATSIDDQKDAPPGDLCNSLLHKFRVWPSLGKSQHILEVARGEALASLLYHSVRPYFCIR